METNGKMELFNASIRAICVIVLLAGFVFAIVWGVFTSKLIVSSDAYIGVLTSALVWWFKSRDDQQSQKATADATTATIAAVTGTGGSGPGPGPAVPTGRRAR
jgi:hypothetical protein